MSLPPVADTLAVEIQARMIAAGTTVASAESCTGGNIGHRLTLIPGSSAYYVGGIISYANSVKEHVLGVPAAVLASPGAVSEPCAVAMAQGARRVTGADLAIATTGIAGPDGGTDRKPVGTVYIALVTGTGTIVEQHHFRGDRAAIIAAATTRALELLLDASA